jgi:hypothetical protein
MREHMSLVGPYRALALTLSDRDFEQFEQRVGWLHLIKSSRGVAL